MKPKPPEAVALRKNDTSSVVYLKAENEYAGRWLDQYSDLSVSISRELKSNAYTVPREESAGYDTSLITDGPWKITVKNKKEVHLISNGNERTGDRVIYTESDPLFNVTLHISTSKNYIFIESSSGTSSETRFLPANFKFLKPELIQERKPGLTYRVDHFGGSTFWILTNENAPNRCIMITHTGTPDPANWKAVVRENDSVYIDDYTVINLQFLVLVQRKHLSTAIEITDLYTDKKSGMENKINFPEPEGRISDLYYDRKEDKIVFRYSSIITPLTSYTYGIHSMHMGIRWKKQIKNYVQDDYRAEVIWIKGENNSRFPVSLMRKINMERQDGANPLVLFIDVGQSGKCGTNSNSGMLSLLDRGCYIACLHLKDSLVAYHDGPALVNSLITSLTTKKNTSLGLITLAGRGPAAKLAWNAAMANPSWFRTLMLDSPSFPINAAPPVIPFIYLTVDTQSSDHGFGSLSLGSELRKATKPGSTLLISTQDEQSVCPDTSRNQITFILSSYGIKK